MLLFIDQPKQIRVVRTSVEDGGNSRAPIGKIMKANLEISAELRAALSKAELENVEQVIETYREAETVHRRNCALQFATSSREAMDYFEDGASEVEQQLIMSSLTEALRRVRRFERTAREG